MTTSCSHFLLPAQLNTPIGAALFMLYVNVWSSSPPDDLSLPLLETLPA